MPDDPGKAAARRKLPARYYGIVMPLILSGFMTCVVSLISTWHGVGLIAGFTKLWLGAWAHSWVVAFPLLLLVLPLVRTVTGWWVEEPR